MDWLTATRSFCQLVDKGSFTGAAGAEEVSPSAISKRIDWLEKQLGLTLFVRTTRQVNLTEIGQEFLPKARSLLKQFDSMVSDTQQIATQPSGLLKISATLAVGSALLMPIIEDFLLKYPALKIQLDVQSFGALPALDHDIVLLRRHEEFNSSAHRGINLISYQMQMYASPVYLTKHKKITSLAQAAKHKMILSNYYRKQGMITLETGETFGLTNYNFVSDHVEALLYGAVQGMGIIFVAPMYIKKELELGQLVPVLPEVKGIAMELWAYYPKTEFISMKSRLFLDFMKLRLR
jgi:DNA-binding transcriptional LysR family regulator